MKTKLTAVLTLFGALTVLISAASAQDKFTLQYRPEKGKSYGLRTTMDQKISQTIQGQKMDMMQTIGISTVFDVMDVAADGVSTMKLTYGDVLFKQKSFMGEFAYDSSNPPERIPPPALGFAGLKGQALTMQVASNGAIKNIQGIDALIDNMLETMALPDGPMRDAVIKSMKNQFGEEAMKESMQQTMMKYPEKPLGIGDSWTNTAVIKSGYGGIVETKYTVAGRKDGVVTLKMDSQFKPNADAPPMEMGMMKMRPLMSGEQNGEMQISEATGLPIGGKVKQKLSGKLQIVTNAEKEDEMSWPIAIESDVTIESFNAKK